MAEYRLSAKIIGRSAGRSSVAAAAYRAGAQLHDERSGIDHDFTRKRGVLHSEILAPDNSPDWMKDRAKLWNAVEAVERRKDAQLAREIQLSLPHELTEDQNRAMMLAFIQSRFVDRGMIADVAMHAPDRSGDQRNIHAHVMLTTRVLTADGFGKKNREWNGSEQLVEWRKDWAEHQNQQFQELGLEHRVDHRSYADQGIDKEPTQHLGPVANDMERKGRPSRIGDENRARQERNTERAALVQDAARNAQALFEEQGRQEEIANTGRAALQSYLINDEIEMDRRHSTQSARLDADLSRRNEERRQQLENEQRHLERQLQADGWRKLMRDLTGKSKRDREELTATRKNLENMQMREATERQALQAKQEAEKEARQQADAQRRHDNAQKLEQERTAGLEAFLAAQRAVPIAPAVQAPSNDRQPPPWARTAAAEQDNAQHTHNFQRAAVGDPSPKVVAREQSPQPKKAFDKQRAIEDHKARIMGKLRDERSRDGYEYD